MPWGISSATPAGMISAEKSIYSGPILHEILFLGDVGQETAEIVRSGAVLSPRVGTIGAIETMLPDTPVVPPTLTMASPPPIIEVAAKSTGDTT